MRLGIGQNCYLFNTYSIASEKLQPDYPALLFKKKKKKEMVVSVPKDELSKR